MSVSAAALHGAWSLEAWRIEHDDSRPPAYPFGDDATGQILYAPEGRMSAVISRRDRAGLDAASIHAASAQSCRDAYTSFFCYAGRWHVDGDDVVHTAELALNPDMAGTQQRRHVRLHGDRLELSATETDARGRARTHRIIWRRVRPAPTP